VGQKQTFQVLGTLAIDAHADLALLKVSGKAPSLVLGRGPAPVVGDNVFVIGNPLGLEGTFSEGIISGIRATGTDSLLQMTAPISPGSSGGPVLDAAGEVIGIAVATFKEGQNLNLAVPVAYLERMLEAHPATLAPLQSVPPRPNAPPSILDGFGSRTEDGVIATDFRYDTSFFGDYRIRLTNKLPVAVSEVGVVVVFYDSVGKMLDFDQLMCDGPILAGLTKDFSIEVTGGSCKQKPGSDVFYEVLHETANGHHAGAKFNFKAELRVIRFRTEEP
jgi:hypothetical protein